LFFNSVAGVLVQDAGVFYVSFIGIYTTYFGVFKKQALFAALPVFFSLQFVRNALFSAYIYV